MRAEGISPAELDHMVAHAAISSLVEGFNRRFHNWLFEVRQGEVFRMREFDMKTLGRDRGNGSMCEECEQCEGAGCKDCGWIGEVRRFL